MTELAEVGRRLRHHRAVSGLTVEEAARSARLSRALLYRYEGGGIVKLDVLDRLARLYGTSLSALLGLGQEYLPRAVDFFERLQVLEEDADHITTVFGPLAYVLSSAAYDEALFLAISRADEVDSLTPPENRRLRDALRKRKIAQGRRQGGFVNVVPLSEVAVYLASGLDAAPDARPRTAGPRQVAAREIEHLCRLIEKPPMGVQIAVTARSLPTSGFQILRRGGQKLVVTSPFRLGAPLNLRYGVAVISSDAQALQMYETLAARLWEGALTGSAAVAAMETLIAQAKKG